MLGAQLLLLLVASSNSASMAGPPAAAYVSGLVLGASCAADAQCASGLCRDTICADYFTSLLVSNPETECACANVSMTGGESVTTARASSAYCTASTGAMTLCGNNLPRISNSGLLVEGARTNSILRSAELDNAAWGDVGTPTVTADSWDFGVGSSTGETIEDNDNAASEGREQSIATTTTGSWTCSARMQSGTTTSARIRITVTGGTGTGTCGISGLSGTTSIQSCSVTAGAGVTDIACAFLAGANDAETGSIKVGGAQLEAGAPVSSYIATTGTAATRAAEVISLTPGTAISSAGCAKTQATYIGTVIASGRWIAGTGNNAALYAASATTGGLFDGTNNVLATVSSMAARTVTGRSEWGGSASSVTVDGVTQGGSFDGTIALTTVYLGAQSTGITPLFGYLKAIKLGSAAAGCTQ